MHHAPESPRTITRHPAAPLVEPLEGRRLLSGTLAYDARMRMVTYTGTDGADAIDVSLAPDTGEVVFVENGKPAGRFPASVLFVNLSTKGGNDVVNVMFDRQRYAHVEAGAGNDRVVTDTLGGDIYGQDGNDYLRANENNVIGGGRGADDMGGGNVWYGDRGDYLVISVDDVANDGGKGEGDNVHACFAVTGGDGNDRISGGPGVDRLYGGNGNDRLWGNDGNDITDGGDGDDVIASSRGNDAFYGGPGTDTADYSTRSDPLRLSLDGLANDGGSGEKDTIRDDVENLIGGSGNDKLYGNADANRLEGRGGNDELYGRAGNDRLIGGTGADALHGGDGDDFLDARDGAADFLSGDLGSDTAARDGIDDVVGVETYV
ncbi:MAG TPA: calcium-binding protein [Humisphaera sp.]